MSSLHRLPLIRRTPFAFYSSSSSLPSHLYRLPSRFFSLHHFLPLSSFSSFSSSSSSSFSDPRFFSSSSSSSHFYSSVPPSSSSSPSPSSSSSSSSRSYPTPAAEAAASAPPIPLFSKILIANRGEIAVRVIKTCKRLGISTVAIYSEPDRYAVHVKMADESICVGPAASSESYLSIPKIVDACLKTGAKAVHPGYGFLSENRHFQEALQKNGIKFIGPGTHAIAAMGDKISSKKIAKEAKVNIIPGHLGRVDTDEEILKVAREIGYPVMIKASAGGGGKGMRIAWNDEEALSGYKLSRAEAKSSFGDDTMFVEKFIEEPRHIEIQLLLDSHGNGVYLNERECSVQRRNQKVIEEAPSVFLTPQTRAAMGEQAVALAKAVGYESAGTCEFLVDKNRNFYFLEMNTRLQVEHPVTEAITGVDLVEQMIRIAAGAPLPFTQQQVTIHGWAFESRVYAEDPLRGFLPSIGTLKRYVEPKGDQIRVDSGIREGSEISIHYDPMISKLITFGETRDEALQKMREALDSYVVRGVTHNINFLRSLCDHPRFIAGRLSTKFIPDEYPDGYKGASINEKEEKALVASALLVYSRLLTNQASIEGGQFESWDGDQWHMGKIKQTVVNLQGKEYQCRCLGFADKDDDEEEEDEGEEGEERKGQVLQIEINGETVTASSRYERGELVFVSHVSSVPYTLQIGSVSDGSSSLSLIYAGTSFSISILSPLEKALSVHMPIPVVVDTSRLIVSPMPGAVFSIKVSVGDTVVAGQEVCVIEAMKMQNALRVVKSGKVKSINVKVGQTVQQDSVLIELE